LEKAEEKFRGIRPLGTDIGMVKQQMEQLKAFKAEVDPHVIKVETPNRYENLSFHVFSYDFDLKREI